jgi:hypothetical protein
MIQAAISPDFRAFTAPPTAGYDEVKVAFELSFIDCFKYLKGARANTSALLVAETEAYGLLYSLSACFYLVAQLAIEV